LVEENAEIAKAVPVHTHSLREVDTFIAVGRRCTYIDVAVEAFDRLELKDE